jgi:hypothetical protein
MVIRCCPTVQKENVKIFSFTTNLLKNLPKCELIWKIFQHLLMLQGFCTKAGYFNYYINLLYN